MLTKLEEFLESIGWSDDDEVRQSELMKLYEEASAKKNLQRVIAVQDGDGHWYIIPEWMRNEFFMLLGLNEAGEDDFEEFNETFEKYFVGGDLNLVQLWADIN
jgi:hypothetical protein